MRLGGVSFDPGDPYMILGLLGQGAFGAVAAGLERETGKRLAIKHICPIAADRSGARHILREVTIMRLLRYHPNVSATEQRKRRLTHDGSLEVTYRLRTVVKSGRPHFCVGAGRCKCFGRTSL